jgi:mannose-6-phosphate isomerase-like protein (cupin superfamily)
MWHATLRAGAESSPVRHKTVNELWYFVEGEGELWRGRGVDEEVVEIHPGRTVSIPSGVSFQFRNTGDTPLCFLGVTMPRFPGPPGGCPRAVGSFQGPNALSGPSVRFTRSVVPAQQ